MKAFVTKNFLPLIAGLLLLLCLAGWGVTTMNRSTALSDQQERVVALQETVTKEQRALDVSRSTLTQTISGLDLKRKTLDDGLLVADLSRNADFVSGSFVSHVTEITGDTYHYFASVQLPDKTYLTLVYTSKPSGALTEVARYSSDSSTLFSSK